MKNVWKFETWCTAAPCQELHRGAGFEADTFRNSMEFFQPFNLFQHWKQPVQASEEQTLAGRPQYHQQ